MPMSMASPNFILLMSDDTGWGDVSYNNVSSRIANPGAGGETYKVNPPRTPKSVLSSQPTARGNLNENHLPRSPLTFLLLPTPHFLYAASTPWHAAQTRSSSTAFTRVAPCAPRHVLQRSLVARRTATASAAPKAAAKLLRGRAPTTSRSRRGRTRSRRRRRKVSALCFAREVLRVTPACDLHVR